MDACSLLVRLRADLSLRNVFDCDVGHFAAMGGSVDMCQWVVDRGISLARPQKAGHSALHKAAEFGQMEVVRYLLAGGGLSQAQINDLHMEGLVRQEPESSEGTQGEHRSHVECHRSEPPSILAARAGHNECAEVLASAGF